MRDRCIASCWGLITHFRRPLQFGASEWFGSNRAGNTTASWNAYSKENLFSSYWPRQDVAIQLSSAKFKHFLIRILQMRAEFQMYQNSYSSDDLYIYATLSLVWSRSCQDLLTIMFRKGGTRGWDGNSLNFVVLSTCYSMTSLLAHTVAQPTKWRFLPKNSNQLVISIFELAFTWSWIDKNRTQF